MGRYPFAVRLLHSLHLAGFDRRTARHVSPLTMVVYRHPSDEETARKIRSLTC